MSACVEFWISVLVLLGLGTAPAFGGDCLPITQARDNIGKTKCITGKVIKVTRLASGTHFLNFCEDYRVCPFQVVVFRGDLKHVGGNSKVGSSRFMATSRITTDGRKSS